MISEIKSNYLKIKGEIEKAPRGNKPIKICCVTKYSSSQEINYIIGLGAEIIGENKVQDAEKKFPYLDKVEKHFIGNLQSNKIKKAMKIFDVIQSVTNTKAARKINSLAEKVYPIFIQVNIAREKQKNGFLEEDLEKEITEIKNLKNLRVLGLMAILPNTENKEELRKYFKKMKQLNDKYGFKELSMGMSQDYLIAIEEGTTMVRIGSAIFK